MKNEDQIKFDEIKNKIIKDFEPVLKAYDVFLTININDLDAHLKIKNLENAAKSFFVDTDDDCEMSYAQAHYQFEKKHKE